MTMLDERLRRVGEELDRAALAYAALPSERTYVTPAAPRPRRQHVAIAIVVMLALFVGAALALRASSDAGRTVADSPEGLAIAQNLGDQWLWPAAESPGVPAGTPDAITREFAVRVLGLSEFTVVHEAPDPGGMRIETPTMSLSLLTTRVLAPTERWVVYEVKSTELSRNESGLVVTSPAGTASVDVFVRDASGSHAGSIDNPLLAGNPIVLALNDELVSALVLFHNSRGEVIGVASLDADSITAQSSVTCTFELSGEQSTASLHAAMGDTASAKLGAYTARVEVVETLGRAATARNAAYPSLRVDISGPPTPSTTPNDDLPPGVIYRSESGLSRTGDSIGGGMNVDGGRLTFTCTAQNPGSR